MKKPMVIGVLCVLAVLILAGLSYHFFFSSPSSPPPFSPTRERVRALVSEAPPPPAASEAPLPARRHDKPLAPEVAAAAEQLSPGVWRDHAQRADVLAEAGSVIAEDIAEARQLTPALAAMRLEKTAADSEALTKAGSALGDDPVLRQFMEEKKAAEFALGQRETEHLTAAEEEEAKREIEEAFGPGITPRDVLVLMDMQYLAVDYETAGQYHKALSLYAALRDRLWSHRRSHFFQTLDMVRQILALGRIELAYEVGMEHFARFWDGTDAAPDLNREFVLLNPILIAQKPLLTIKPAMSHFGQWLELTLRSREGNPGYRFPMERWFHTVDQHSGRFFDLAWPYTKLEQEAWFDAVAEQWPAPDARWLSPEFLAYLRDLTDAAPPEGLIRRATLFMLAGRAGDAARVLLDAPELDPNAFGLLARLVVFTEGDPRLVDPENVNPALKRLPAELGPALARHTRTGDPEGLYAAGYRDAFLRNAERAARKQLQQWLDNAAHAPRERLVGMAGHPAMEALLAKADEHDWPSTLVRQLADNHQRQRVDTAGGEGRWRALEGHMAAKNYAAAMAVLQEIESRGPLWFNGKTTAAIRPQCQRGLAFARFHEALSRDPASAREAFVQVRAFLPTVTLREALKEAGWRADTPGDLQALEKAFAVTSPTEKGDSSLGIDWGSLVAEVRLVRAGALADRGDSQAAREALADMATAATGAMREQAAEIATRLAREEPFDRWWEGQKKVAFMELPERLSDWHARIFFDATPTLAEDELLPLLRGRVEAWGEAGRFTDSYQGWEALFRVQREPSVVKEEAARFEAWLERFEQVLPREDYAAHAALLLDVCPDYDTRDRLGKRLFRQFEAETPEATVAAIRRWAEGRLKPGQQREFSYQVANYLYLKERFPEAIAVLSTAEDPTDQEMLLRALCLLRREENSQAVEVLETLAKRHPASQLLDRVWFTLGWTHMVRGDRDAAKTAFQRVVADYPDSDYARQARNFLAQLP